MNDVQRLQDLGLKFLSFRPRSKKELETYLSKKTSDQDLVAQIIKKFEDQKLINDQEFATWLIESRSRSSPRGSRLLKQELKQKGIDLETINDYRMTTNDEIVLAKKAMEKKLNLWKKLSKREVEIKAKRFLMTRGFSWETIEKVVKSEYN